MSAESCETVDLARLEDGLALWPAIEAAQYAHVIDHDEPRTRAEREAIAAFTDCFVSRAEEWDRQPREAQAVILDDLGRRLAALSDQGLALYGAIVERDVAAENGDRVRLPIALLAISRSREPVRRVSLPVDLEAG